MKKFLPSILAYSIFASAALWVAGLFLLPPEIVSEGSQFAYKSANSLSLLFDALPSILLTGFLLACSLAFAEYGERAQGRFSPEIALLLKKIMAAALVTTFIASIGTLVLLPFENSKKKFMREIPGLMTDYMRLSEQYRLQKNPEAAIQYIRKALALDPNNKELKERERQVEAELKEQEGKRREERNKSFAETNLNDNQKTFQGFDEKEMTVLQMIEKARELFASKDFFGAHYLSVEAERLCGPNDPNIFEAKDMANQAWNRLQSAQKEELTAGNLFFRKKWEGYKALNSGNFEEAYYIFNDLAMEDERKARDPDVARYLKISRDRLLEQFFFIDETYDASRFESSKNVYFSIRHPNGGYDIILIRGVTEVGGSGGMVRYLRGLELFSFDEYGQFKYSVSTPYAKMKALDVKTLGLYESQRLGLTSAIKSIPYIMMRSVSRNSREQKNEPVYEYNGTQEYASILSKNQLYLPIPYEDISLILLSAAGKGNLNPFSLNRLARKAPNYGYSSEVFSVESLNRIFYPFMLLIIFIFAASVAWNYRLSAGAIFKFKWIFILPVLNLVFYFLERLIEYLIKVLNLVFIAMAGTELALLAGICVYVALLIAVSVVFLARKND
ncbi:MAG: hypothetical protein VZQ47_09095 [Treponema sp.]|nr:hypothetical protein [Treponema sp.]MEE3435699.1 hypothetical protein [Treponema sp.]